REINLPSNIKVSDLGTGGIDVIHALEGWTIGIILDAVDIPNLKPGEIITFEITSESIPSVSGFSSTHGFDIFTALQLAFQLQDYLLPNRIIVIGIQIEDINGLGTELSQAVINAKPIVLEKIFELLEEPQFFSNTAKRKFATDT
ncbi:MAG: hydrogenase maturation protease, partial [Candidatus Thorarchaeota archaeon]